MQKRCTIKQFSLTTAIYNRKTLNLAITPHINKLTQCGVIAISRKRWYNRKAKWVALRALSKNNNGKPYLHILHSQSVHNNDRICVIIYIQFTLK